MSITLRPYQKEAEQKIIADWAAGYTDLLLTMATGLGKTAVFLSVLNQVLTDGKRGLILAHRKELIEQPLERLYSYFPSWLGRAGVVMADTNEPDRQLIVATVQSLSAAPRRINQILSYGPIDYLVVDEAHHFIDKNSYHEVYVRLKEANPAMRHLGVTATPIRADGDGLGGVYQKESGHYGIVEGIKQGYLAPVRWLAIQTAISLDNIKLADGDFVRKQLADVYETKNCFDLVVASHQQYADGRQAVAFTVSVDGAYDLAEAFNAAGIKAAAADGTTDKRERSRILRDFVAGRTQVLCNVGLYTEGLDVPQASCIHQVRPTKSDSLYTQMIGRALRIFPGKEDALVLDYAPMDSRNIAMMGDVLGMPLRKDAILETKEDRGEVMGGFTFDGDVKWMDGNPHEIISRQLDYLQLSPWSWYRHDGWMSLDLGISDETQRILAIEPPSSDHDSMTLYLVAKRGDERAWKAYRAMQANSFDELSEWAEDYAGKRGNATLAAKQRNWRKESPSDAQIRFAQRLRAFEPGMTKGLTAQAISHALAMQAIRRLA